MLSVSAEKIDSVGVVAGLLTGWATYKFLKQYHCHRPPPSCVTPVFEAPGLKGAILGWLPTLLKNEFPFVHERLLKECQAKYGEKKTSYAFDNWPGKTRVLVAHPYDLEYVYLEHPQNFVKGPDYDNLVRLLGDENLVTIRDEAKHAAHRRMIAPAFNAGTLKNIADDVLRRQVEKYLAELAEAVAKADDGDSLSLDSYFDAIALGTIAEAAFKHTSIERGTDVQGEFRKLMANFSVLSLGNIFPITRPFLKTTRRLKKVLRSLRHFGVKVTDMAAKEAQKQQSLQKDVLIDFLLREKGLGFKSVMDHTITFLFAGHETTSKALMWTTYLLAANPQIQNQLYEELCSAVSLTAVPSLDTVKDLPLLGHCIKESMRLYPPVPAVLRHSVHDDVLPYSKVFVPANTAVLTHVYLAHRLPSVYGEDADEFRPERWNKEEGLAEKIGPCGWMPFIVGKRNCIGKDFAWNELLVTVATLFRRFKVAVPEGSPRPVKELAITIRPKEDIPFLLSPRTD